MRGVVGLLVALGLGCDLSQDEPVGATRASIRDGTVASSCDWPAAAWLAGKCSGALLGKRLVVFAGHCGLNVRTVAVTRPDSTTRQVDTVECHRSEVADLAVCTLAETVDAPAPPLLPGCLEPRLWADMDVAIVGFGLTGPAGQAGTKKYLHARIAEYSDTEIRIQLADGGTCSGDSGGPVYAKVADSWYLLGVVSKGDAEICDASELRATPLRPFAAWIEAQTRRRASPCELGGQWSPSPSCSVSVKDSASQAMGGCLADLAAESPEGPCAGLPLAQGTPCTADRLIPTPGDARTIPRSALGFVGLETPGCTIGDVEIKVSSPAGRAWSQGFEVPPFQIPVVPAVGQWEAHVEVDNGAGEVIRRTWTFVVEEDPPPAGCSVARAPAQPSLPVHFLALVFLLGSPAARPRGTRRHE